MSSPASSAALGDIFAEVTAGSGIDFIYRNGEEADQFTMAETLGGGVALIDYDRDGKLDIFLTGGGYFGPNQEILGHPCKLYRNEGNWKFRDVTAEVGLDKINFYSHGATVGDYDNDGWPDLLITGYGRMALYRNNHGKFEDMTEKAFGRKEENGIRKEEQDKKKASDSSFILHPSSLVHWSTSAAWGDFDGDGLLDLYVAHYADWSFQNHPVCESQQKSQPRDVCLPRHFQPLPHEFYLNNGDGTFRDASREAGLRPGGAEGGRGLGVLVADFDDDGKLDIYVANDASDKFLYLNQSERAGEWESRRVKENQRSHSPTLSPSHSSTLFREVGRQLGVAGSVDGTPEGSMGVDAADIEGTGKLSIFVTNYAGEVHALYRQRANGRFQHASALTGIMAIGQNYVGFGTAFLDFDLDGAEDLIITNGHAVRYPSPLTAAQRPVLLRNVRQSGVVRFLQVTNQGGPYFQARHRGRGLAVGDLDNDGKVDVVISHLNEPVTLLRNVLATGHHWLGVELVGKPNADAIGAKLTLEAGPQKLVRHVKGGGSYLSSNDRRIIFGLGDATRIGKLTVRWPSGRTESWDGLPIDRYSRIEEGTSH